MTEIERQDRWNDDQIQFPRVIEEAEAAGAFTDEIVERAVEEVRSRISALLSPLGFKIIRDEDCPDIKEFHRTIIFTSDPYRVDAAYDYISKQASIFLIRKFETDGCWFERILNLVHLHESGDFGDDPYRPPEEIIRILSKEGLRWVGGDHSREATIPSYTDPIKDPNKSA